MELIFSLNKLDKRLIVSIYKVLTKINHPKPKKNQNWERK